MERQLPDQVVTLTFRLSTIEQNLTELKAQLDHYVPLRENDLQLNYIREVVGRIEKEVVASREQINSIDAKVSTQERNIQQQGSDDRETSAALQIKVLWGIISLVFGTVVSILVGYVTHFFH